MTTNLFGAASRRAAKFAARATLVVLFGGYALGAVLPRLNELASWPLAVWAIWLVVSFIYKEDEWDQVPKPWVATLTAAAAFGYLPLLQVPAFTLDEGWLSALFGMASQAAPIKGWVLWAYQPVGKFLLAWAGLSTIWGCCALVGEHKLYPGRYAGRHAVALAIASSIGCLTWVWLFPTWGNTVAIVVTGMVLLALAVLVGIAFDDEEPMPEGPAPEATPEPPAPSRASGLSRFRRAWNFVVTLWRRIFKRRVPYSETAEAEAAPAAPASVTPPPACGPITTWERSPIGPDVLGGPSRRRTTMEETEETSARIASILGR